jgi:hypothetical protein
VTFPFASASAEKFPCANDALVTDANCVLPTFDVPVRIVHVWLLVQNGFAEFGDAIPLSNPRVSDEVPPS